MSNLGTIIKEYRINKHLSQKELAEEICTQPLISAIEKNKYIPNGIILIKIFKKLGVSLDQISLDDNLIVSNNQMFNNKISSLCNSHQYKQMYKLLNDNHIQTLIVSDIQEQTYYYYLAVSILHTTGNYTEVIRNLELSLTLKNNFDQSKQLGKLAEASLGYIASLKKQQVNAKHYIDLAISNLESLKFSNEQLMVYYLAALSNYQMQDYSTGIKLIKKLIKCATKNNSHYLLANAYYLLALMAIKTGDDFLYENSVERKNILQSLFDEKIFKDI